MGRQSIGKHVALRLEHLEPRLVMTGVVINEFLASNVDGIVDQDGDHSDWIELVNTSAAPVDISGWRLTDDPGNLSKWTLPTTTLNPGEYLKVFASDKNRAVAGEELHTNFKLAKEGEYLALVAGDGTTVLSSFDPYPAQRDDVSYGSGTNPNATATETLVGASSELRVHVPTGEIAAVDDKWREIEFDDATWLTGIHSVGFDRNGATDGAFGPFGKNLSAAEMPSSQYTAYVRYSFDLANKEQLTSLALTLKFDDGFMAFINGREVKQVNFGDDFDYPQPAWNSRAGNQTNSSTMQNTNRLGEALTPVTFDLTPYLPSLVNGTNVLAFHLVNGTNGANDLLLEPTLTATRTSGTQTGYMAEPTPDDANGVSSLGFTGDTHFSMDRGFFNAPFQVTIAADLPTASIRYTTDGSLPSAANGMLYTGPITVSTTTVLRAIAYQAGYTSSNVDTQTYVFLADVIGQNASDAPSGAATWGHGGPDWEMDPDIVNNPLYSGTIIDDLKAIPTVSLVMDWADLFSNAATPGTPANAAPQGIYLTGKSKERYASFEYFSAQNVVDQTHADIAVEIQGHSSTLRWRNDKLSFQVKFKYPYGDTELNYPLFAGTPDGSNATGEFDTVILDAISNYGWTGNNPTVQGNYARYVTDQVTADLQNLASGGGQAPHGKYVHLYLNGLYWGMYNMHERPDVSFAAEYYGGDKDDYYAVKAASDIDDLQHRFVYVEGGVAAETSYKALRDATRAADYNAAQNMLDVDQFMDYMIVHFYAGNANDWPHNNWYATRSSLPSGKWRFHEWDQEHAFPTTDNASVENPDFDQTTNATIYETNKDEGSPLELHRNLMANAEYRLRFSDRVQALMQNGGALTPAVAQAAYEARLNEIDRAIVGESARWGDNRVTTPYTREDFRRVAGLAEGTPGVIDVFFPGRTSTVLGQFTANDWISTLGAPTFNQYGGEVGPAFTLSMAKPLGSPGAAVIYYTTDGTDPRLAGGALNPVAQAYTGPIAFTNSTRVQARIYFDNSGANNDWSAVIDETFLVPTPYPVRIVELNYNPGAQPGAGDAQNLEYFELLNTGNQTVSLDGVQIGGFASNPYSFALGLSLAPGGRIVVAKSPATFQAVYGSSVTLAPAAFDGNLSNGGERVTLLGPAGETLQDFTYSDAAPWPTTPDGAGRTLEIVDPLGDPTAAANWRPSFFVGGSPGSEGLAPSTSVGDFDADVDVDGSDFLAWQRGRGTTALHAAIADGDADYDRDVDDDDLAAWAAHFGEASSLVAATRGLNSAATDGDALASTVPWILIDAEPVQAKPAPAIEEQPVDVVISAWEKKNRAQPVPIANESATFHRISDGNSALTEAAIDEALGHQFSGIGIDWR
jgi:hypothetical protein